MPAPLSLSLPRKLLYATILSVAVVGLVLGTLELGLRVAGYGHSPHFFRPAKSSTGEIIWRENRDALARFFPGALIRRPQPIRLAAKKAPRTVRIFVLGSSAAMGDPEPAFSLARVLELQLRRACPDLSFEVVNAAVTAINSHVMREIAADCAALEPDLFVVYEGNNEVIGPFGPTGVLAPFLRRETAIRALSWLKGTRTGQLITALGTRHQVAGWGGMELFLQQQIPYDDPRLAAVETHFAANLRAVAATAREAGATVMLCTVATNQRDFAPFLSQEGEAERLYREGRAALAAGQDEAARPLLQQALDHDTLRFRTDSRLNDVIRAVGREGGPGVELVDTAAALAAKSPHGITGDEFLYEHVHLTLRGTDELARALLRPLLAQLQSRGLVSVPSSTPLTFEEIGLRLGYTTHEQTMIALELLQRFAKPPFSGQSDIAARRALWQRRAEAGQALLARPDATAALRELAREALELSPADWLLARNLGAMLVARQQPAEALPLLQRAAAWIDDDVDTLVPLGWAHRALGHTAEAEAAFARARALEPHYPNLPAASDAK